MKKALLILLFSPFAVIAQDLNLHYNFNHTLVFPDSSKSGIIFKSEQNPDLKDFRTENIKSVKAEALIMDSSYKYSFLSETDSILSVRDIYSYNSNGKIVSDIYFLWDYDLNQWDKNSKQETTYDLSGILSSKIFYIWDNNLSKWTGDHKYEYSFNSGGDITLFIFSMWDVNKNKWIGNSKEETAYDSNGQDSVFATYYWDQVASQWIGQGKYESDYNMEGQLQLSIFYTWNNTSNNWIESQKTEFSTELDGKRNAIVYLWDVDLNQWNKKVSKDEQTFDINGNLTLNTNFLWDSITDMWDENYKMEYTYNMDDKLILSIKYLREADLNIWIENIKHENAYDPNGKSILNAYYKFDPIKSQWDGLYKYEESYNSFGTMLQQHSYYRWDTIADQWMGAFKYDYKYDSNNNKILDIYSTWDTIVDQWTLYYKEYYYFSIQNHSNSIIPEISDRFKIYPNPVIDNMTIEIINDESVNRCFIYTVLGQIVGTYDLHLGSNFISLSQLQKGTYILQILSKSGIVMQTIVKE